MTLEIARLRRQVVALYTAAGQDAPAHIVAPQVAYRPEEPQAVQP